MWIAALEYLLHYIADFAPVRAPYLNFKWAKLTCPGKSNKILKYGHFAHGYRVSHLILDSVSIWISQSKFDLSSGQHFSWYEKQNSLFTSHCQKWKVYLKGRTHHTSSIILKSRLWKCPCNWVILQKQIILRGGGIFENWSFFIEVQDG